MNCWKERKELLSNKFIVEDLLFVLLLLLSLL